MAYLEYFRSERLMFAVPDADRRLKNKGPTMRIRTEDALVASDDPATCLPRVPAQRAFWFGWHAQYPDTLLIQRQEP